MSWVKPHQGLSLLLSVRLIILPAYSPGASYSGCIVWHVPGVARSLTTQDSGCVVWHRNYPGCGSYCIPGSQTGSFHTAPLPFPPPSISVEPCRNVLPEEPLTHHTLLSPLSPFHIVASVPDASCGLCPRIE